MGPSFLSDTAMVLAAGFGTRMRPLTADRPKPLLEVGGRTMLDQALDRLRDTGIKRAVVNTHYLGDQIERHVASRRDLQIILSPETEILETGGGVKKALRYFGGKPFFVLASDLPLRDGVEPALMRMAAAWDETRMDALLLVYPLAKARGFGAARGDFMMEPEGRLWRKGGPADKPYVFLSVMIIKPELYETVAETAFSNNLLFDRSEEAGRLYGLVHDGACYHVGTPEDLAQAEHLLQTGQGWD